MCFKNEKRIIKHFLKFHIFEWKSLSIFKTPLESGYWYIKF